MKLRRYRIDDFEEVLNLHREVLQNEKVYRGSGVWETDLYQIAEHYFDNGGDFIVGLVNDKIIAMGAFRKIDFQTAEVVRMRVDSNYQGRGFGNEILLEIEKTALNKGYKFLILETDERLSKAIQLYKKNGFEFWKEEIIEGFKCDWYKKKIAT